MGKFQSIRINARCSYVFFLQSWAALGLDAATCCVLHRSPSIVPLRSGWWIWWPQRHVVSSVRFSVSFFPSLLTELLSRFLGQNSKQGKLSRQLGDVQIRMRLKVSGDKSEIRQSYLPALFPHIVKPLMDVGAVGEIVNERCSGNWRLCLTECRRRCDRTHGRILPVARRLGYCSGVGRWPE